MALTLVRKAAKCFHRSLHTKIVSTRFYSLYEPDYLELLKPKIPIYADLHVQIKSFAFPVLESYQAHINTIADHMDIDVEDSFAVPPKKLKVQRLKPKSDVVDSEYLLNEYERSFHLSNVSAIKYPIFLRILQATLPEGVKLHIEFWNPLIDEKRYVPDKQLLDLKSELSDLKGK